MSDKIPEKVGAPHNDEDSFIPSNGVDLTTVDPITPSNGASPPPEPECIPLCISGEFDEEDQYPDYTVDGYCAWSPDDVIWNDKGMPRKELTVKFLNDIPKEWTYCGGEMNKDNIMCWANMWNRRSNGVIPKFVPVLDKDARSDIRVKFNSAGITRTMIGNKAELKKRGEATMMLCLQSKNCVSNNVKQHFVVHEFGHALGLYHEHQRPDFWKVIEPYVDMEEMKKDLKEPRVEDDKFEKMFNENWAKLSNSKRCTPYDADSVMHYSFRKKWLKNGYDDKSKVIEDEKLTEEERTALLGIHKRHDIVKEPSNLDIEHLEDLYGNRASHTPVPIPLCTSGDLEEQYSDGNLADSESIDSLQNDPHALSVIWSAKENLRVKFLNCIPKQWRYDGGGMNTGNIISWANEWTYPSHKVIPRFFPVKGPSDPSDIRVSFTTNGRTETEIGNRAEGKEKATMWLCLDSDDGMDDDYIKYVVVHEFGHALGLGYRHQRPDFLEKIKPYVDEKKMKADLGASDAKFECYWGKDDNFKKGNKSTPYDSKTVMHYWFPKEWLTNGYSNKRKVEEDKSLPSDKRDALLGIHTQHCEPSERDIKLLKDLYVARANLHAVPPVHFGNNSSLPPMCIPLSTLGDLKEEDCNPDHSNSQVDVLSAWVPKRVIWTGRKELGVKFLNIIPPDWVYNGRGMNIGHIMSWANEWTHRGYGIIPKFTVVKDPSAPSDIRVEFNSSRRTETRIGNRAQHCKHYEPTMSFDLHISPGVDDDYIKHSVVHQFGHVLGLGHEHQRSDFWQCIEPYIDREKMVADVGPCRFDLIWGKDKDFKRGTCTPYDSKSVMHFWFRKDWLIHGYSNKSKVENDPSLSVEVRATLLGVHERDCSLTNEPSDMDIQLLKELYDTMTDIKVPSLAPKAAHSDQQVATVTHGNGASLTPAAPIPPGIAASRFIPLCASGDIEEGDCSLADPGSTDTCDSLSAWVPRNVIWSERKVLGVKFLNSIPEEWTYDGSGMNTGNIMSWANEWGLLGNGVIPRFVHVKTPSSPSDIRVMFTTNQKTQAIIGRRAQQVRNSQPTMWLDLHTGISDDYKKFLVIHEFGHALGLGHEHQRSDFWKHIKRFVDVKNMKADLGMSEFDNNWDTLVDSGNSVRSMHYDPSSVMHYWFRKEWLTHGYSDRKNVEREANLSEVERAILLSVHEQYSRVVNEPSAMDLQLLENLYGKYTEYI